MTLPTHFAFILARYSRAKTLPLDDFREVFASQSHLVNMVHQRHLLSAPSCARTIEFPFVMQYSVQEMIGYLRSSALTVLAFRYGASLPYFQASRTMMYGAILGLDSGDPPRDLDESTRAFMIENPAQSRNAHWNTRQHFRLITHAECDVYMNHFIADYGNVAEGIQAAQSLFLDAVVHRRMIIVSRMLSHDVISDVYYGIALTLSFVQNNVKLRDILWDYLPKYIALSSLFDAAFFENCSQCGCDSRMFIVRHVNGVAQ